MNYKINQNSEVPIYRQLCDMILADVKSGELSQGDRLPTVRELSDELGLARGTVKRSYDELRKNGIIDMTQGRGTFVRYQPMNSESRKERAMAAIDKMLESLNQLDISPAEMEIFIGLKLREYVKRGDSVKIAFIECSPEILGQIADRFRDIGGAEVFTYLLDEILRNPYRIEEDVDIIVTSATHAEEVSRALHGSERLTKVALAMRTQCIKDIARLEEKTRVGIACCSERFGALLTDALQKYSCCKKAAKPFYFGGGEPEKYLEDKDALLLPINYAAFCSDREAELFRRFSARHILVLCSYQADQGSTLYLGEKIRAIKERKKL